MNQTRRTIGGLALPALTLMLLLFVGQSVSLPAAASEADIAALPPDADNVEFHHVKLVNGVMTEDHPVIMYKEDFVSEDYDPTKNETTLGRHRTYSILKRTRHHHSREEPKVEKQQEKILFDVQPENPIVISDDDSIADKFEAAPLLEPTKQQKFPKKYHSRHRRQAYYPAYSNNYYLPARPAHRSRPEHSSPGPYYLPVEPPRQYQRFPQEGKKPKYRGKLPAWQGQMPTSIGTRLDDDSLFHNSNPDDADFSVFDKPRPQATGGSSSMNFPSFQTPPEEEDRRPIWGTSAGRRPSSPVYYEPAPVYQSPPALPAYRQDLVLYPAEPSYEAGTACHRASELCCSLGNLGSLYDCFHHQNCENSLSEILTACS